MALSTSPNVKQESCEGSQLHNQLNNVGLEPEDDDVETYQLDKALKRWVTKKPPFIDRAIPEAISPGDHLEVWKASGSGAPVRKTSPKSSVTCCRWRNSDHKYWTWDFDDDLRYIVGGISEPNSLGWISWLVWHGEEYGGFTGKRVLWTRVDTQGFTPLVTALQKKGSALGRTDQFHYMREAYKATEKPVRVSRKRPQASLSHHQREPSPSLQLQDPLPTTDTDHTELKSCLRKRLKRHPDIGNAEDAEDSDMPVISRQPKQLRRESRSHSSISIIEGTREEEQCAFDSTRQSSMHDLQYGLFPALTPATTVSPERASSTRSLPASSQHLETISISSDTEDDEIRIKEEKQETLCDDKEIEREMLEIRKEKVAIRELELKIKQREQREAKERQLQDLKRNEKRKKREGVRKA